MGAGGPELGVAEQQVAGGEDALPIHANGSSSMTGIAADKSARGGWTPKVPSLWSSASVFDSWLIAAAAQVGQVVLTLPYSLSQMGIAYGVALLVVYGILGAWSVYLLTWLYFEFKVRMEKQGKVYPERHVLQYHEVVGGLTGTLGGYITRFFIIVSLALASVIQLIASASDLYYANDSLDKRQWQFVVGGIALLAVLLPNFGHFRAGAVVGLSTTTITALYLTVASLVHGQDISSAFLEAAKSFPGTTRESSRIPSRFVFLQWKWRGSWKKPLMSPPLDQAAGVKHTGANSKVDFFTGATNILFAFGGHGITIEIMEAMRRPSKFKFVYMAVVLYTFCITIPSSVSVYWAFGDVLLKRSNAFAVLPPSPWRTVAIIAMVLHQSMGFMIFVLPVFLVCEKAFKVHTGKFWLRVLVRIPVVALLWFLALAIPFFGPINSVMGALLVTVGVYIIPLAAFIYTYRTKAARQNSAVKLPPFMPSWVLLFLINGLIILWILVVGVGFGGWASITNFVRQIRTFGFFDKCFQCPPASVPKPK